MVIALYNFSELYWIKSMFCDYTFLYPSLILYVSSLLLMILKLLHFIQQSRNPSMASSSSAPNSDAIKPEVFDGTSFKRWQARTRLWLMELGLLWVLTEEPAVLPGDDMQGEVERARLTALRTRWENASWLSYQTCFLMYM